MPCSTEFGSLWGCRVSRDSRHAGFRQHAGSARTGAAEAVGTPGRQVRQPQRDERLHRALLRPHGQSALQEPVQPPRERLNCPGKSRGQPRHVMTSSARAHIASLLRQCPIHDGVRSLGLLHAVPKSRTGASPTPIAKHPCQSDLPLGRREGFGQHLEGWTARSTEPGRGRCACGPEGSAAGAGQARRHRTRRQPGARRALSQHQTHF